MPGQQPPLSSADRVAAGYARAAAGLGLGCLRHLLGRGVGGNGLANHRLSVLAAGLDVLADVTGSATLI
jgi:hypothetical protein